MTYQAKVISGGKVVIPAELRREFGIKDGDSLIFDRSADGSGMALKTYAQVVKEVQAEVRRLSKPDDGGSIVDELLADRREDARREREKYDRWLAAQ
jgi:AbrB family transcriptional regulator, stage V sporulation protein T